MEFKDIIDFVEENKQEYFDKMIAVNQMKLTIKHLERIQSFYGHDIEYGIDIAINTLKEMIAELEK